MRKIFDKTLTLEGDNTIYLLHWGCDYSRIYGIYQGCTTHQLIQKAQAHMPLHGYWRACTLDPIIICIHTRPYSGAQESKMSGWDSLDLGSYFDL